MIALLRSYATINTRLYNKCQYMYILSRGYAQYLPPCLWRVQIIFIIYKIFQSVFPRRGGGVLCHAARISWKAFARTRAIDIKKAILTRAHVMSNEFCRNGGYMLQMFSQTVGWTLMKREFELPKTSWLRVEDKACFEVRGHGTCGRGNQRRPVLSPSHRRKCTGLYNPTQWARAKSYKTERRLTYQYRLED